LGNLDKFLRVSLFPILLTDAEAIPSEAKFRTLELETAHIAEGVPLAEYQVVFWA
jgi:hypothetical protein